MDILNLLSQIHWNTDPEMFNVFGLSIRWYGFLYASAFLSGYFMLVYLWKMEKRNIEEVDEMFLYLIGGVIVGARLGHCLFYDPMYYLTNPVEILFVHKGGLASHGGVIGLFVAVWLFIRKKPGMKYMWLGDRLAIPIAFVASYIRVGNFFNSEIIGRPVEADVPWAVVFERIDNIPRHPAQMYEAVAYILISIIAYFVYRKYRKEMGNGLIVGIALILIFAFRMFVEVYKENQSWFEEGMALNMGQILSIPFILIGSYLVYNSIRNWKKNGESLST